MDCTEHSRISGDLLPVIYRRWWLYSGRGAVGWFGCDQTRTLYRANAVGTAIAQVSGEIDSIFSPEDLGRDQVLATAKMRAIKAAEAGLPVVDGDGMGRAFPEVQMTTFAIYGARQGLAAIADGKGNVVLVKNVAGPRWMERFLRIIAVQMGARTGATSAPMLMSEVRRTAIPNTVSQALKLIRPCLTPARKAKMFVEPEG